MIVQCDKCQTKFRIADTKVNDAGVKVRCSKCAHVFVVRRDAITDVAAATRASTVKVKPETLQSMVGGSQRVPSGPAKAPVIPPSSTNLGSSPVPRNLPPSAATTQEAMSALGFGSAPPRGSTLPPSQKKNATAPPPLTGLPKFPDSTSRQLPAFPESSPTLDRFPAPSEEKTEQVRLPKESSPPPGSNFEDHPSSPGAFPPPSEPFAKRPSGPGTFPKSPSSPGGACPKSPSSPGGSFPKLKSEPFGKEPFGAGPFGKEPFGSEALGNRGSGTFPPPPGSDPFGHAPSSSPGAPPPPAFGTDPFGTSSGPDPFADNPLGQPAGRKDSDPAPSKPKSGPISEPASMMFPPPPEPNKPRTNVEHLVPAGAVDDDPFSELDDGSDPDLDVDLDGMDDPPGLAGIMKEEEDTTRSPAGSKPLAKIKLGPAGTPDREDSKFKTTVAAAYVDDDLVRPGKLGAIPTFLGAVVGLCIALFYFPGLLAPEDNIIDLKPEKLIAESIDELTAENARVSSYPGRAGHRMLIVSGAAHNSGEQSFQRVQAVVMVLDGDEIVERRRAMVGIPFDEADLSKIGNAADVAAIYEAARARAKPADLGIEAGASARFVVVFPEIPEGVEARRFRVEFVRATEVAKTE